MTRHALALRRLWLLTAIHFTVDMLSGTLPGFLPALRHEYSLPFVTGTVLLTLCSFSSNGVQLWAGTLRKHATRPLLVQLGLILSCAICFVGLVPQAGAVVTLSLLILILGVGVAFAHPEGLRGVCAIPESSVSPAVATSLFMLAGFSGYATGPLIGGFLVDTFGFRGLFFLLIPVALLLWFFHQARVKLALDKPEEKKPEHHHLENKSRSPLPPITFRQVFFLSVFINSGCGIMQGLLSSYLREQGFSLTFGGFSATLFGLGAGLGAFGTSFLVKRIPVLTCIKYQIAAGIPLLCIYLAFAGNPHAAVLAPFAGALVGAGFPQLVVLARNAPGSLSLGSRMGVIVGGSWGIAGIFLLLTGVIEEIFSLKAAMFLAPASFAVALVMLFTIGKWNRRQRHSAPVQLREGGLS